MKWLFSGGGTLGPVTPLLAIVEAARLLDASLEFVWVGTPHGPEAALVRANDISFQALSVPKLVRHAPLRWLLIPFQLVWSLFKAFRILRREQPAVVVSAGGYVSVPLVWMASALGIPSWIHGQDVRAGLANKLMAPFADKISTAWETSLADFDPDKTIHLGNPVRSSIFNGSREAGLERFGFSPLRLHNSITSEPTLVVMGGGTGANWINEMMGRIAVELESKAQVLHVTGVGKHSTLSHTTELIREGMNDVYAMADVIVCRAGMGTISELAAQKKAAIVIPIPASQQEDNAAILETNQAAIVLHQTQTTPQILLTNILRLLGDENKRRELGDRLHRLLRTEGVAEWLAQDLLALARKEKN